LKPNVSRYLCSPQTSWQIERILKSFVFGIIRTADLRSVHWEAMFLAVALPRPEWTPEIGSETH